ncbi:alpha-scruin [Trichonephila clavipes]|nr:alpha-scruin [Trichonephila clavipes]
MGVQANWLRALKLLTHRFEEAICALEFLQLEVNFVIEMLSAQTIGARSEVLVFLAALNWLNYDYANREEHAVKVMECVRFSTMTMDEIVACYHPPFLPQLLDKTEIVMHLFRATCRRRRIDEADISTPVAIDQRATNCLEEAHQKCPPTISNVDLALNWHKPTELDQASSRLEIVKLDSSVGHSPNGYNTDIERMKLEHENGVHHQDPFPRESFQYFGSMQQQQHPFQKLPDANPKTQCYSTTNLTVAVQKVFQECAQTSENAVNIAEVVKKVLEEINSDEWKGKNVADKVLDTQDKAESTEEKKERNESNSGPSRQTLPFKARSSPDHIGGQTFQNKKSPDTQKPNLQDSKNNIPLNSSSEKNSLYKEKKNSHQEEEPFELIIPHTTSSREFKDPYADSVTKSRTDSPDEKQYQFPIVNRSRNSSRNLRDKSVQKFLSSKQPLYAKGPQISERLPSKAILTSDSSIDIHKKEDRSSSVMLTPEIETKSKKPKPSILVIGGMNPRNIQTGTGGCDPLETKQQNRYIAERSCYKLDINKQQWSSIQDMKFKRYDHGLAVLSGHIYAIGGQDDGERLLKTVEVYDIKKNKWKILPSEMCCGRKAMGSTAFSGKIWIAGGLIQADKEINFQVVSHVDCYDPKHKRWLFNVHSLPSPRCYCSLTVWMRQICCVGGMIRDANDAMRPTNKVWFFNSDAEMGNYGPTLPIPRMGSVALVYGQYLRIIMIILKLI